MILRLIAVPLGIAFLAVSVWLFRSRPFALSFAFLTSIVAMIALYRNEDIVRMVVEPRKVMIEISRKSEEVRHLAEKVGEITAFNMTQLWRLEPEDPSGELLRLRDELATMLHGGGLDNSEVSRIIRPITERVERDVATRALESNAQVRQDSDLRAKLVDRLTAAKVGEAESSVRPALERIGAWADGVRDRIAEFEEFRRTGKLPRISEAPRGPGTLK